MYSHYPSRVNIVCLTIDHTGQQRTHPRIEKLLFSLAPCKSLLHPEDISNQRVCNFQRKFDDLGNKFIKRFNSTEQGSSVVGCCVQTLPDSVSLLK